MKTKYERKKNKKFPVELTEEQIAIIKAGLQYYWLDDDYGYALWYASTSTVGGSDTYYRHKVGEIYGELNKRTKVKPDYGWWGDIKRMAKLCKAGYEVYKKECEKAERRMYEDSLLHETIAEHFNMRGLNGNEISSEVLKEFNKKVSEIKSDKEGKKNG